MSNFLSLYKQKYKGGVGKSGKPGKKRKASAPTSGTVPASTSGTAPAPTSSTSSPSPPLMRNPSLPGNDITVTDIEDIQKLVKKLNDDLNLQLIDSFDYKCYDYILELDKEIYGFDKKGNIEILECFEKYRQIYEDNKNTITDTLKSLYESRTTEYKKIKCYLDGYDIIHDVGSISLYINQLTEIYKQYDSINGFVVKINSHKLSQERERMIENFKNSLTTVSVLTSKDEVLTEMTGYVTFFHEICKINNLEDRFIYMESGRHLLYSNLIDYYKKLNSDPSSKDLFEQLCIGDDTTRKDIYQNIFKTNPHPEYDFTILTDSISSFDGCPQTMTGNPETPIQKFEDIYSFYDYYVHSKMYTDGDKQISVHIVAVTTNSKNKENSNKLKAFFLIQGEPSINFLVKTSNAIFKDIPIDIPRQSKSMKDKITNKSPYIITNYNLQNYSIDIKDNLKDNLNKLVDSLKNTYSIISDELDELDELNNDNFSEGYWFSTPGTNDEKQLILFGIKTVGDLMFTCDNYKNIKLLTTTDSYIKTSVLYNYLCGKSEVLQSVWRKDSNKGWIYSKGILSNDPVEQTKQLLIKFASILGFIKYYLNKERIPDTTNKLTNLCYIILRNVFEHPTDLNNHSKPNFDRIANCLKYIEQLNQEDWKLRIQTIINQQSDLGNMYDRLSYVVLNHEIEYKYKLINQYVDELCKINERELITSIEKMNGLSNIFYLNTISLYENNKLNIVLKSESKNKRDINTPYFEIAKGRENSRRTNTTPIYHNEIFNVDPKLQKVIIKGLASVSTDITDSTDTTSKRSMIDINILNNENKQRKSLIFENDETDGKRYDNNIYKKDVNRKIQKIQDESYIITKDEKTFDGNIYYKLINDTLNYEELEILTFSPFSFSVTSTNLPNILELGRYDNENNKYIYIYLWKVKNKIGNLFKLLSFNSIRDDSLSTSLIFTRILTHFKYILTDHTDYAEITCDAVISKYIKNFNEFMDNIIKNVIELKQQEIQIYEKVLELELDDMELASDDTPDDMEVAVSSNGTSSSTSTNNELLEELNNMNKSIYDKITNSSSKKDIEEQINLEIKKCKNIIDNFQQSPPESQQPPPENHSDQEIEVEEEEEEENLQLGGTHNLSFIQKYIIKTYLHENYRNKFLFDGPSDDNEYDDYDNLTFGETFTIIPEVEIPETTGKRDRYEFEPVNDELKEKINPEKYSKENKENQPPTKKNRYEQNRYEQNFIDYFKPSLEPPDPKNYKFGIWGGKKTKRQNDITKQKNKKTRRKIK